MANYTENYQLHQWESTDDFLRTDFNEDFSKIDTALGRAERSATSNAYNIYNLILQNYYESKYTGYKSALIFDGFMDDSNISSLSEGFVHDEDEYHLRLDGMGQSSIGVGYGSTSSAGLSPGASLSHTWTATGHGQLTMVKLFMQGSAYLTITNASGESIYYGYYSANSAAAYYTPSTPITLTPGDSFTFTVTNADSISSMTFYRSDSSYPFGYYLTITPTCYTQGTMVSTEYEVGTWENTLAWVRHVGGSCTLTLSDWDMTETETRTLTLEDGTDGLETAFSLSGIDGDDMTLTLNYDVEEGTEGKVFDYGIIFL